MSNKEHLPKPAGEEGDFLANEIAKNKFRDYSLEEIVKLEAEEMIKIEADANYCPNPDLRVIREWLGVLDMSLTLYNTFNGGEIVEANRERAKYLIKILKQHRWFNELLNENKSRFNKPR